MGFDRDLIGGAPLGQKRAFKADEPLWRKALRVWAPLAGVLLAGCATHPAPPPSVSAPVCLPMRAYTKAQQQEAASELAKLPQGSVVAQMVVDYGAMRDADRACQSSK